MSAATSAKPGGATGSDEPPVHYTAQAMWGLGVTRRRRGIGAAPFGADELRGYSVDTDAEANAALRAWGLAFWRDHVLHPPRWRTWRGCFPTNPTPDTRRS